jgi:hypothetical protein
MTHHVTTPADITRTSDDPETTAQATRITVWATDQRTATHPMGHRSRLDTLITMLDTISGKPTGPFYDENGTFYAARIEANQKVWSAVQQPAAPASTRWHITEQPSQPLMNCPSTELGSYAEDDLAGIVANATRWLAHTAPWRLTINPRNIPNQPDNKENRQ